MIYDRFGGRVRIVRRAILDDVERFEKRRPDKRDRQRVAERMYVICETVEDQRDREFLADVALLRADGGWATLSDALDALDAAEVTT